MGDVVDVTVVGAGIAGASLAFELAADHRVLLLEREERPGYHSSGRSAAMLIDSYGTHAVRRLTQASRGFFERPPDGFVDRPLLSRRGYLHIARQDQLDRLHAIEEEIAPLVPSLRRLDAGGVLDVAPLIDPAYVAVGLLDADAMAIDDAALHEGYLKGFARRGGKLITDADVMNVSPADGVRWQIETRAGVSETVVLVNAAGAWADGLAEMADVDPIGLQPKRRTAILLDPPEVGRLSVGSWPMVNDVDERFYVKPEGGALMVSPADETPSVPTDAQPEELDVAIAVDRYQTLTGRTVRSIRRRWAGLRSFVADHSPVIGFDVEAPGFFWLAGQGGFGFMTAPAAARLSAALIRDEPLDAELAPVAEEVSPARLRKS